jgi:hypothetical protein
MTPTLPLRKRAGVGQKITVVSDKIMPKIQEI